MKKIVMFLVIVLLSMNFGFTQDLTSKEKKAQQEQEIKEMIESRDFVFHAKSIKPISGDKLDLSSSYDLTIQGLSVVSNLPYYYLEADKPIWVDDAITFNLEAETMQVKYNDRRNDYEVFILVNTGKNIFNMKMVVRMNGCTYLSVMSTEFETVSYFGTIGHPEYIDAYLN